MSNLRIFGASLILTIASSAQSGEPIDFAFEMMFAERLPPQRNDDIYCIMGCDWERRRIECPESEGPCRVVIAGRSDYAPPLKTDDINQDARPISGTVCLGVNLFRACAIGNSGTPCNSHKDQKPEDLKLTSKVMRGSPAAEAGMRDDDVATGFNGLPVHGPGDMHRAVQKLSPGDPFEITVERDGVPINLRGRLGMRTSDFRCAAFDSALLQRPTMTAEEVEALQFEVDVPVSTAGATFKCLKGCAWPGFATGKLPENSRVGIERQGYDPYVGDEPRWTSR
jgi:hypothetical protein